VAQFGATQQRPQSAVSAEPDYSLVPRACSAGRPVCHGSDRPRALDSVADRCQQRQACFVRPDDQCSLPQLGRARLRGIHERTHANRRSQYSNRSIRVLHRVFVEDSHSPGLYEPIDRADRPVRVGFNGQGSSPMGLASRTPWSAASPRRIVTTIEADHPAPKLSWRLPTSGRLLRVATRANGSGFAELPVESA
jgi:hypothetical protein